MFFSVRLFLFLQGEFLPASGVHQIHPVNPFIFYYCFSCTQGRSRGSWSPSSPSLSKGGQHAIEPHTSLYTRVFGQFIACFWAVGGSQRPQTQGEHADPTQEGPGHSTHNLSLLSDNSSNHSSAVWSMYNSFLCKVFHLV